ncbi:MAG: 16S rRNA (guanine(966)-N(2))-methyltransferase RsmD [Bacteroidetes bacterium]|nr:16S rRNA (guanine(966)-N(2))-methyltransferase RsmD [Bacteroidota bacterium]MBU1116318.1 16S rRNA (guanine(966)-N(2))-methyltransferase RsmD [Bacteroidota bacterium]MBU1798296.1 16S rRNA (guanine(966)-N(2))-methyltransferase RsmD [Bacteroidota bacterium]
MRIIAGEYRGRTIKFPKSKLVRPTTDKSKETLFNMLKKYIPFDGIKACDIYAGSGSLGLEALSRGADEVHFVEKDFKVLQILSENIESLNAKEYCKIFKMEALRFSKLHEHSKYDLIIADPPYFKSDIHEVFVNIMENDFLEKDGVFVIERSTQTQEIDEQTFGKKATKRLGDSLIYIFAKEIVD